MNFNGHITNLFCFRKLSALAVLVKRLKLKLVSCTCSLCFTLSAAVSFLRHDSVGLHAMQCLPKAGTAITIQWSVSFVVIQHITSGSVADSRGGGGRPPIDRMHLKTGENFARKCTIFA